MIKNPLRNPLFDRGETCKVSDTESLMLPVPCGICHECLQVRQNSVLQRVHAHSMENYMFMFTLTYNSVMIPHFVLGDKTYNCFNYSHFNKMLQRIRRGNLIKYPFTHLVVGEYGTKRHRPHYHGLICFNKKYFSSKPHIALQQLKSFESSLSRIFIDNWSINIGSRKRPEYVPLFTYAKRGIFSNFDLHFVDVLTDPSASESVSHYVTKYLVKSDDYIQNLKGYLFSNFPRDIAFRSWQKLRPRVTMSRHFGINRTSAHYIDECFTNSFNTGKITYTIGTHTMPMCSYFVNKFIPKHLYPHDSLSQNSVVLDTCRSTISRASSYTKHRNDLKKKNVNNLDYFLEL